jgi:hypothetical protein
VLTAVTRKSPEIISHVFELVEKNNAEFNEVKEVFKKISESYDKSKTTMKNVKTFNSIIDQCFDKSGKIDKNSVELSQILLDIGISGSDFESFLKLAKTYSTGQVSDECIEIMNRLKTNFDSTRPNANSFYIRNFIKSLRTETKTEATIDKASIDLFDKMMKDFPKHTDETGNQYMHRLASYKSAIKSVGYSDGRYDIVKQLDKFNFKPNSVRETLRYMVNCPGFVDKFNNINKQLPNRANIVSIDITVEAGALRQTITYGDKTQLVRDYDFVTLKLNGEYHNDVKPVPNRKYYTQEVDDGIRGMQTRTKLKGGGQMEETTVIRDPKTKEVIGVEYISESDVPNVLNIQYRDIKNGGITKTLSSGTKDEFGNMTVVKNYESLDGTRTNYNYKSSPDGSYSSKYVITQNDGTEILNETRTFNVIDSQHFESTCNGKRYYIELDEDNILIVTKETGESVRFDVDDLSLNNMDNQNFVEIFKRIPGHEYFQMAKVGTTSIGVQNVKNNAHYLPSANGIELGEGDQVLSIFLHEFGHNKDSKLAGSLLRKDKDLASIYVAERFDFVKAFPQTQRGYIDYFIGLDKFDDRSNRGLAEVIAESNMLLNEANGVHSFRSEYLRRFFPKTIAYIAKKLNPELY